MKRSSTNRFRSNQQGSLIVGAIILFAVIILTMRFLTSIYPDYEAPTNSRIGSELNEEETDTIRQKRASLQAYNGLQASGDALMKTDGFTFQVTISAALPELEDQGYYEAYIIGPSEIYLGRPKKDGPTWRLTYASNLDLNLYDTVRVVVDGPRNLQNQSIPLPFTILEGKLR